MALLFRNGRILSLSGGLPFHACSSRIHRSQQEPGSVLCCLCRRGGMLPCTGLAIHGGAVAVFYLLSLHPEPYVGSLAAGWSGRAASDLQCYMGTISKVVCWSFLRQATQFDLMGSSLRTALISRSSSLPVGVNMVRWAVNKW